MADTGTYLYAVTLDLDVPRLDVKGVANRPVRTITQAELVAYVSEVPLDQFGEEPLRRSMEDLDWLGETARGHHRVVAAVAEHTPTAPIRLVTVYSGDDQVRRLLDQRHDDFVQVLSQIAGRVEWGVKAYVHPTEDQPTPTAREPADRAAARGPGGAGSSAAAGAGTAYLKRRQAGLRSREDAWRDASEQAQRIHHALTALAVASHLHRPQDPQLSGRSDWMILNGAYLVDEPRSAEFAAALDGLRGPGVDLQLTGPWAPYSFAELDAEAPR
ncbi:GvpL/GvpF family gas vesicle protein [Nonomuraea glycinis]|uniref:GvpL/GvpF family gas vesicle protein n=1 Tax=Nonomuraea glycinis TaxID=2047744 RepID=UPI0033A09031